MLIFALALTCTDPVTYRDKKIIGNYILTIDPGKLKNMPAREISDLKVQVLKKVLLEMKLKIITPCDQGILQVTVSNIPKKHMES